MTHSASPKLLLSLIVLAFSSFIGTAQVVYTDPIFPIQDDSVTIYFDASLGNAALAGFSGDIYVHTGVITTTSTSGSDWQNVQGVWGTADAPRQMTALGGDLYRIGYNISSWYGLAMTDTVLEMAFVFRNADGSIVGREADGSDIYAPVYQSGLNVTFLSPVETPAIFDFGTNVPVEVVSSNADSLFLYVDDVLSGVSTNDSISTTLTAPTYGSHILKAIAKDATESIVTTQEFYVRSPVTIIDLPAGVDDGINYIDDSTVTLVLHAPGKEYVFAIGDHSLWGINDAIYMNRTPDSSRFWVTLNGLNPGEEYAYQYFVDGEITVGDPYTDKVLDPGADGGISATTYPDLKDYPDGASGIVSIFETAQTAYNWTVTDFEKPKVTDLVVYELLVRDYTAQRNFQTVIDTLDYLVELGVNAIELMPIMEFENNDSWGYNSSWFFAPDKYYGPKDVVKEFVDACHERGIAVILDIALNHAFSQCALAQLYWDPIAFKPTPDNPWMNPDPTHDFNVGYDFNHESPSTQKFSADVFKYWVEEYKVDGYRIDLSKGFTQNNTLGDVNAWGNYDASRVAILKAYADSVWSVDPEAYVILEHFADNTEEKELAEYGMLIWGNLNHNYTEGSMGYSGSSLQWASYLQRGWSVPHAVVYMESHDEERMMYKNVTFGNSMGSYDTRDFNTALFRCELASAFFFTIPGPKMIWQFGELGYDFSIDYNGRTGKKPIKWEYFDELPRKRLYQVYSELIKLKTELDLFETADFEMATAGTTKRIKLNSADQNAVVLGNFEVEAASISPAFQHTGWWYEFFSGDSINVTDVNADIALAAGEYRLYFDEKMATPDILSTIEDPEMSIGALEVWPNPSAGAFAMVFEIAQSSAVKVEILNLAGQVVYSEDLGNLRQGRNFFSWNGKDEGGRQLPAGNYILTLASGPNPSTDFISRQLSIIR